VDEVAQGQDGCFAGLRRVGDDGAAGLERANQLADLRPTDAVEEQPQLGVALINARVDRSTDAFDSFFDITFGTLLVR
jgi:hypothetical protein